MSNGISVFVVHWDSAGPAVFFVSMMAFLALVLWREARNETK